MGHRKFRPLNPLKSTCQILITACGSSSRPKEGTRDIAMRHIGIVGRPNESAQNRVSYYGRFVNGMSAVLRCERKSNGSTGIVVHCVWQESGSKFAGMHIGTQILPRSRLELRPRLKPRPSASHGLPQERRVIRVARLHFLDTGALRGAEPDRRPSPCHDLLSAQMPVGSD